MNRTRLVLRWLLIPLWFAIFIAYLPIWYLQMSWYYFCFQDYWDAFLVLWDKAMLSMRLKTRADESSKGRRMINMAAFVVYICRYCYLCIRFSGYLW